MFEKPLIWPPLAEELQPFMKYCTGVVLNAGSGSRAISFGTHDITLDMAVEDSPAVVGDLHHIPLLDNSVDTVVCIAVLEHTRHSWRVAEEFYRVLTPGGYGVIATPFLQPQHACPHDYVRFTSSGLQEVMKAAGFTIVASQAMHHFGQTLAWLLWKYIKHNRPPRITWFFWKWFLRQLSLGTFFKKDSPDTHNTEYVVVTKPGAHHKP